MAGDEKLTLQDIEAARQAIQSTTGLLPNTIDVGGSVLLQIDPDGGWDPRKWYRIRVDGAHPATITEL